MATATQSNGITVPIEQLARLIRALAPQQKALLLQLVPELQTIQPTEAALPPAQKALLSYFHRKLEALPTRRPMRDDDPFLNGLTVADFFALPEEEQARIWNDAHAEAERELGAREQSVRPDALPAR